MHPTDNVEHDLREGAALVLGWLETVFRYWDRLDEAQRKEMLSAALLGANEVAVAIDRMNGRPPREIKLPEERMADVFANIAERDGRET